MVLPLEGLILAVSAWQQGNDNVAVEIERPHEEEYSPELVVHLWVRRRGRVGIDLDTGSAHFYGESIMIDGLEQSGAQVNTPYDLIALLGRLRDSLT